MTYVDGTTFVNTIIVIVSGLCILMGSILYSASRVGKQKVKSVHE